MMQKLLLSSSLKGTVFLFNFYMLGLPGSIFPYPQWGIVLGSVNFVSYNFFAQIEIQCHSSDFTSHCNLGREI